MQQLPVARRRLFPLAADLVESKRAQLELAAQPPQYLGLLAVRVVLERAGDVVRALALLAVVDEAVLGQGVAQPFQRLGVDAGPEQREVADVAVVLAAGAARRL